MTATIRPAVLALAALLLIAGCGGSASTGHTAQSGPLSCQQLSARVRDLLAAHEYDDNFGEIAKAFNDLHAARAAWDSMHKKHCPASSYAQANQALSTYGIHF